MKKLFKQRMHHLSLRSHYFIVGIHCRPFFPSITVLDAVKHLTTLRETTYVYWKHHLICIQIYDLYNSAESSYLIVLDNIRTSLFLDEVFYSNVIFHIRVGIKIFWYDWIRTFEYVYYYWPNLIFNESMETFPL